MKTGYRITLQAATGSLPDRPIATARLRRTGFYSTAVPVTAGVTGRRAFASSTTSVLFVDTSGVAPTEAAMAPGGGGSRFGRPTAGARSPSSLQ